jgi:hypothetical protein
MNGKGPWELVALRTSITQRYRHDEDALWPQARVLSSAAVVGDHPW